MERPLPAPGSISGIGAFCRREAAAFAATVSAAIAYIVGSGWFVDLHAAPAVTIGLFAWIFAIMMWSSFAVVRHADGLAELLG